MMISWSLLVVASFLVVLAGANEPYFTLKIFEAYALLSAAPAILTLWLVWAVAAVLLWRARRLSGAIFFSFVLSIYFVFGVVDRWLGYLPDLERAAAATTDHSVQVEP